MENAVVAGDRRLGEIVYCYRFPAHPGRVKIGYSSRGLARVSEQSTAFPEKPELLFVIHDRRAKAIEAAFHEALAHRQADVMGTEWFDVGWKDILAVSPILRRARGTSAGKKVLRAIVLLALMSACGALYVPLSQAQLAMAQGLPFSLVISFWETWFSSLGSFDVTSMWEIISRTVEEVWTSSIFWPLKGIPAILSCAPLLLPRLMSRRQAY